MIEGLSKLEKCVSAGNIAYIHRIDNVLFSHSGLTEVFVSLFLPDFSGGIDELLEKINGFRRDELWCDASPIWARPQDGRIEMYPKLLADYMKDMDRECVYVLNFDNAMRPISFHLTSMGGSNYAPVDPVNIFKRAMLTNASFIMVMHVHPGGSPKPSSADIQSTEKISMLGNFLHILVRDHLIVAGGTGEYISLKAEMPDIFHEIPDCSVAEPGQLKEQPEEQHTEHTTDLAATEQGTAESAAEKSITEQAKTEETPQHVAEQSQPYDPLALTLEQKEILFVKEAPEAMELAKALESLGNENAGYTPKENDLVRKEWLLNTAQDIKDGNTATIIKAVSDMSKTTGNIAVTKKAVGFLIKLDAVKGK